MVPGSLAIIAKAYPKDERGGAIGIWAAASSLTTLARAGDRRTGADLAWPVEAGRLIFALNLPLGRHRAVPAADGGLRPTRPGEGRKTRHIGRRPRRRWRLLLISLAFIDSESGRFLAVSDRGAL